jgi:hypothetical protein
MIRDLAYLKEVSPCNIDIYDVEITSKDSPNARTPNHCPRLRACMKAEAQRGGKMACTLRMGKDVAGFVAEGSTLEEELDELRGSGLFRGATFVHSEDRKTFTNVTGVEEILTAVRGVAEKLLE